MESLKDTSSAMLKRAAKAILKDELKLLRWQLRNNKATVETLQRELKASRTAATEYSLALGRVRQVHSIELAQAKSDAVSGQIKDRCIQVDQWAAKHAQGNYTLAACVEYIAQGAFPKSRGDCQTVHPFDRWNISPKPEDVKPLTDRGIHRSSPMW